MKLGQQTRLKGGRLPVLLFTPDDIPWFFISDHHLANEPHLDENDRGMYVVYWIKDSETDNDTYWQFVFESVTTGSGDSH